MTKPRGWLRVFDSLILVNVFVAPSPIEQVASRRHCRTPRLAFLLGSFVLVSFVSSNLPAQPTPVAAQTKPVETNAEGKPKVHRQARASVSRIVESIETDVKHVPARALVVSSQFATDTPAPRGSELALLLATQLAGRRGAGSRAFGKPLTLAEARVEARGFDALVMLNVEIASGKLRVVADVFPVPRTVWARVRDPEPGPIAHAFAEAPVDAEVRAYLAPVPIAQPNVTRGQNFESDVVALACGDIDADGAVEVISVSRRRVTTTRLRDGKVVPLRSRNWHDLSPLAPVPLREPMGLAAVVERFTPSGGVSFFLDVGLSDRANSMRLDGQLGVVATLAGFPVGVGEASACVRVNQPWLVGPLVPCAPDEQVARVSMAGSYDAMAATSLVSAKGEGFAVFAARTDRGVLEVRDDAGRMTTVDGAGAQLAVGDLDQDGDPEILSSLDVPAGSTDAIVVRSWLNRSSAETTRPKEMLRVPAAAGVRAIAVCPPDGPGRAPFVVATADEIWVVR